MAQTRAPGRVVGGRRPTRNERSLRKARTMKTMHLILGGRYMGKGAWADSLYGPAVRPCDLQRDAPEAMAGADRELAA